MTDKPLAATDETPPPDLKPPADIFLDFIVEAVFGPDASADNSLGITVSCGGTIASGMAVPRKAWVAMLGSQFTTAIPGAIGATYAKALTALDEGLAEKLAAWVTDGHPEPPLGYLNMKNVVLLTGGTCRSVPLWRTRLDRLDGWSLGSFDALYDGVRL